MRSGTFRTTLASVKASVLNPDIPRFVGCSDIGFWQVLQAKGYPWDPQRQDYYRQHSPLTHAARVTTPTLFLHPENDLRCPIEQSEQFYMTLKMMGKVPVEFVRAPAAGRDRTGVIYHAPGEAARKDLLRTILHLTR